MQAHAPSDWSSETASRRRGWRTARFLLAAYILLGLAWGAVHFQEFPHYGDTRQYIRFARQGRVNEFRGYLYPWILGNLTNVRARRRGRSS